MTKEIYCVYLIYNFVVMQATVAGLQSMIGLFCDGDAYRLCCRELA